MLFRSTWNCGRHGRRHVDDRRRWRRVDRVHSGRWWLSGSGSGSGSRCRRRGGRRGSGWGWGSGSGSRCRRRRHHVLWSEVRLWLWFGDKSMMIVSGTRTPTRPKKQYPLNEIRQIKVVNLIRCWFMPVVSF